LAGDGVSGNDVLSFDEVLDDITLYWLTATATSSARLYWESWDKEWGMTLFYWNKLDRGGHFAAYEQPKLFVDEMRACFGTIR
jgi:epoxide hydrolase